MPAVALCSLNWADLFAHYFGHEDWASPIHAEMLAAYRAATFLRTTPGMPMPALDKLVTIGPLAQRGRERRCELREKVGVGRTATLVVIALGGIPARLPVETWPVLADTHWLVPAAWNVQRTDMSSIEAFDWPFVDSAAFGRRRRHQAGLRHLHRSGLQWRRRALPAPRRLARAGLPDRLAANPCPLHAGHGNGSGVRQSRCSAGYLPASRRTASPTGISFGHADF